MAHRWQNAGPTGETESRPAPAVSLLFPPLVESNFGSLYPAPAVLAGYLAAAGIGSRQIDLNEAFAEYLLSSPMSAKLGAGRIPGVPVDSACAAAARWSARHKSRLVDEQGRHHFGTDSDYGYLMEVLAKPFSVDPDAEVLGPLSVARQPARTYLDFYEWCNTADQIAEDTLLVGISVAMGPQLMPALVLAAHLKAAHPHLRCVLGGPVLSLMALEDLEILLRSHRAVDCVVRFDGEQPLLSLAQQVRDGQWQPASLAGVSCVHDGKIRHNPPGPGPDLNELPYPRYPEDAIARLASPTLSITQARGCYWGKCDYCDFIELYDGSPPFRGRHPGNFVDEVERLVQDFGVRRFSFVTESIPPAFARRMSLLLIERELKVRWNSFAMVDRRFDRDLLTLMVEAGCEYLVIGLETMTTRVLKLVHKSADRQENIRFLRDARAVGMRLRVNLIPDLPSTTYMEALSALADMAELVDCVDGISVFPFEATRSSNVGRHPERFGLLPASTPNAPGQSQYALNHLDNVDPGMTAEERADVHRRYRQFANRVNARNTSDETLDLAAVRQQLPVRLPSEDLDVLDTGEKLVCTNMRTRERITVPTALSGALGSYLDGSRFTFADLAKRLGHGRAEVLVRNLLSARMLTPAIEVGNGS